MLTIHFLHGLHSLPQGVKPTYLQDHGHTVLNPKLPDEDFAEAVRIAQAEFDKHQPQVVVFSDSEELAKISGATLIEVGNDHRLADPEPLARMLKECERINHT